MWGFSNKVGGELLHFSHFFVNSLYKLYKSSLYSKYLEHWSHLFSILFGEDCPNDDTEDDSTKYDRVSGVGDSAKDWVDSTEDEDSHEPLKG